MRYLIGLSLFLLVLGAAGGCARDEAADTSSAQTGTEAPLPAPEPAPETISPPAQPAAPAPAPSRPSRPADTAVRPAPAPEPAPAPKPTPPVESARVDTPAPRPTPAPAPAAPVVEMYSVPAGTPLTVVMSSEVSTAVSKNGDTFEATLAEAWSVDGKIVADRGDRVVGRVQEVIKPGKVKGKAQLTLVLTDIFPGTRGYKISTEPFVAIAVDNKERDAAIIAGGAGIGAAIGAITGGKKGAAIGAIIGGGGGTATVLATAGQDMKIAPETKVNFVLDNAVRLPVIRNRSS